ncbi:SgcJ/EcaC family oxidoreductase [Hymenobacter sp. J193]|uniref:SgcJ/EcaC family oxidoreductase n=1 Tax=Hymenobacter sp. J193 TaxID=2898429 RepID=UPI002150B20B|nr:SgcJ/EcaC family oxidoreductase [Hymenobacter sp. J193]MCR5888021.1 SgcJ/EcaC family oxidoreductase [Hymenobacter sp. J193]
MLKRILLLALMSLLAAHQLLAQAPPTSPRLSAADEAAIQKVVQQMTTNFSNHRFEDMAAYTTPDVSWVNIVGMWWRGRPQVQGAHQAIFDQIFSGVTFTPGPPVVRAITADVALVNLRCKVGAFYPPDGVNRGTNKMGDNEDLLTLVLVKRQGRWLLTAGHNTEIDAAAAGNDPAGKR